MDYFTDPLDEDKIRRAGGLTSDDFYLPVEQDPYGPGANIANQTIGGGYTRWQGKGFEKYGTVSSIKVPLAIAGTIKVKVGSIDTNTTISLIDEVSLTVESGSTLVVSVSQFPTWNGEVKSNYTIGFYTADDMLYYELAAPGAMKIFNGDMAGEGVTVADDPNQVLFEVLWQSKPLVDFAEAAGGDASEAKEQADRAQGEADRAEEAANTAAADVAAAVASDADRAEEARDDTQTLKEETSAYVNEHLEYLPAYGPLSPYVAAALFNTPDGETAWGLRAANGAYDFWAGGENLSAEVRAAAGGAKYEIIDLPDADDPFIKLTITADPNGYVLDFIRQSGEGSSGSISGSTSAYREDIERQADVAGIFNAIPIGVTSDLPSDPDVVPKAVMHIPTIFINPVTKRVHVACENRDKSVPDDPANPGQNPADYENSVIIHRYSDDLWQCDDPVDATWSAWQVLAAGGNLWQTATPNFVFDPITGEIRMMFKFHYGTLRMSRNVSQADYPDDPLRSFEIYEIVSADDGVSWTNAAGDPITLPATADTATWLDHLNDPDWRALGCGPGGGFTMSNGLMVVPGWGMTVYPEGANTDLYWYIRPYVFDPAGAREWVPGAMSAIPGLGSMENSMCEGPDNTIISSARSSTTGRQHRVISRWEDAGQTFKSHVVSPYTASVCAGHLLRLSGISDSRPSRLVHCYPESLAESPEGSRCRLGIEISYDELLNRQARFNLAGNYTTTDVDFRGNPLPSTVTITNSFDYSSMCHLRGNTIAIAYTKRVALPSSVTGPAIPRRVLHVGIVNLSKILGN